jgi:hypothetical protein
MALKSNTFKAMKADPKTVDRTKVRLEDRHKREIDKVVSEARTLAKDRRTALKGITNPALRVSAGR